MSAPSPAARTIAIVVIGLLLLAVAAWLILRDSGSDEDSAGAPSLVSADELRDRAASSEEPIYWAGPQPNAGVELTLGEDGRSFIRYLPPDSDAGDPRPGFLTIATYSSDDAEAAIDAALDRPGAIRLEGPTGEPMVSNRDSPTSVYFAAADDLQIEVYDPSPRRAVRIATSGAVQPIG